MSLRLRVNLLVVALNLVVFVVMMGLQFKNHRSSIQEDIEVAHRMAVHTVNTVAHTVRIFGLVPATVQGFLENTGRIRANDIRFYSADGSLLYTVPPSNDNARQRAPAWFEALMRPHVETTVIGLERDRVEVVPDPSQAIYDAWDSMTAAFLLGLAFVAVLHGAVLLFLRRFLSQTEVDARRLVSTTQALARSREVTRLIQSSIEEERKRLARELHDELGQSVTAIQLMATSIALASETGASVASAEKITEIAAGLYASVHRIVRELRPAMLEQPDLSAALADLAHEWSVRHQNVALVLALDADLGDLDEDFALTVFRSVQEALTNVLKHAHAGRVWLSVARRNDQLQIQIEDDGQGAVQGTEGSGQGLYGMRERVSALGGSLKAGTRPEGGFSVRILLPLPGDIE